MNIDSIIFEAPKHKSMASLSRALNINVAMLRYNLAKARKLDLVLRVLELNGGRVANRKKINLLGNVKQKVSQ